MLLLDLDVLLMALICGGLGAAVVLLAVAVRGATPNPTRPDGRLGKTVARLREPALTIRLGAAALAAAVTLVLTGWPVAALGLGGLVGFWPLLFGGLRDEQQQIERLEALVIWTESLRDTVSGASSLEQAIPVTAQNAPPVIRPALIRLVGHLRGQLPLDRALLKLAEWLDDSSADLVLAALILNAQRRGDGLAQVLSGLSVAAREELEMRRRVSNKRAGLRRSVQLIVLITIAFAVFLVTFGGDYVKPYDSAAGQVALAVVLGIFALGFAWMRQLSQPTPLMPFLSRPGQQLDPEDERVVMNLTGLSATELTVLSAEPRVGTQPRAGAR